jgi:hypothetical protein
MTRRDRVQQRAASAASKADAERVVARPDGYYWVADDGRQEFGPFQTAAQALAAAREAIEVALAEEQLLQQAEDDIGVADRGDHDIVEIDEQASPGR